MPRLDHTSDSRLIFLVCFFTSLSFFSVDLITPSLPSMMTSFQTSPSAIQAIVLIFVSGLGISQFFYGPLSDRFGRRSVVLLGASICLVGNLLATFAQSLEWLMFARFISAFGAGAAMVISRVIFRDRFTGSKLLKTMAFFAMSVNISPAIAPFLGGLIEQHLGWRYAFLFLTLWATLVLITLALGLPETHPQRKRTRNLNLNNMFHIYKRILANPCFTYSALLSASSLAASICYLIMSPFLYQLVLGLSPAQNGLVYLSNAIGFLLGAFYISQSRHRSKPHQLIIIGLAICFIANVSLVMGGLFGLLSVWPILLPASINSLGMGIMMPTVATLALSTIETDLGMASALLSAVRFLGLTVCTLLVLPLHEHNQLPMAGLMLGFTSLSCFFYGRLPEPCMSSEKGI